MRLKKKSLWGKCPIFIPSLKFSSNSKIITTTKKGKPLHEMYHAEIYFITGPLHIDIQA